MGSRCFSGTTARALRATASPGHPEWVWEQLIIICAQLLTHVGLFPVGRRGWGREVLGGWGGSGTQKFVYRKWPDQIFPMVNFVFSHDGPFGWGGGGGQGLGI